MHLPLPYDAHFLFLAISYARPHPPRAPPDRALWEYHRFIDANSYDWGGLSDDYHDHPSDNDDDGRGGMVDDCRDGNYNKPGVIVKRDDDAGYIVMNKPPNVPVHARVDNSLENVASCVGRMLWLERRRGGELLRAMEGSNGVVEISTTSTFVDEGEDCEGRRDTGDGTRRRRANQQGKRKVEPLVYVGSPQRLDQNTSGLLVVATKKSFASYFAGLLRAKTSGQLSGAGVPSSSCGVHKSYRCLVCILASRISSSTTAAATARYEIDRLGGYEILRHYLEPSIRSPKRFASIVPDDADDRDSWSECLLRITRIGEACMVRNDDDDDDDDDDGSDVTPSDALSRCLWGDHGRPIDCVAIVEIEVELLTGRTHQIRGQLAAEGYPLVGDVQYGGAVPNTSSLYRERCEGRVESFLDSERLALQCCSLEFLDPRRDDCGGVDTDGSPGRAKRSERWNTFRLSSAFWTPFLDQYARDVAQMATLDKTDSLIDG
jgi:23S rRNA-/tRNA-specific pseudouridylate synthase